LLSVAYVRRKRFEAQLLAMTIVEHLAQAFGLTEEEQSTGDRVQGASGRVYRSVSPDALMDRIGG
jgi:hypothetical protein